MKMKLEFGANYLGQSNVSFCLWQKVSVGYFGKHANNIRHTKLWPSIENRVPQIFLEKNLSVVTQHKAAVF